MANTETQFNVVPLSVLSDSNMAKEMFSLTGTSSYASEAEKQLEEPRLSPNNESINSAADIIIGFLDDVFDGNDDRDDRYDVTQFHYLPKPVKTFGNVDACVKYLAALKHETVLMTISCMFDETVRSTIHDIPQVDSIYVFCKQPDTHHHQLGIQRKVKGNFFEINKIYEYMKDNIEKREMNSISFRILSSIANPERGLNQLDQSFMYSQLFKEIIVTIEYDDKAKTEFIKSLLEKYGSCKKMSSKIHEFEDYKKHTPGYWYSKETFIYSKVNKALRTQDTDLLIKMGFFIKDLFQQIKDEHIDPTRETCPKTVYRGQGITNDDFKRMQDSVNCLLSFNNFLSTSADREIASLFAESSAEDPKMTGILFCIEIDQSTSSVYFTDLKKVSQHSSEAEILFSMHSVFRVKELKPLKDRLWEIHIKLTDDDDKQLKDITEHMRKELLISTGWKALGVLLIKMGDFDGAIKIFQKLIDSTPKNKWSELGDLYNSMGVANICNGSFPTGIDNIQKAIEFMSPIYPPEYPLLIAAYSNLGEAFRQNEDYPHALNCFLYILNNYETTAHSDDRIYAATLLNIGLMYTLLEDKSVANKYFQNAFEVQKKSLPPNHPDFAHTYVNIGDIYEDLRESSEALVYYTKALNIQQNALLSDDPAIAITYGKISQLHQSTGDYNQALKFAKQAENVLSQPSPRICPELACIYFTIGEIHRSIKKYQEALTYFDKCIDIEKKIDCPDISRRVQAYQNIGYVHQSLNDYSKALSFYNKALENHLQYQSTDKKRLADIYSCIGYVNMLLKNYELALPNLEDARSIFKNYFPLDHSSLAEILDHFGQVYDSMEDYRKALGFHKEALEILQRSTPDNYNLIALRHIKIGEIYDKLREFPTALSHYDEALKAKKTITSNDHSLLARIHYSIASVYEKEEKYDLAIVSYQEALTTEKNSASPDLDVLFKIYNSIIVLHEFTKDIQMVLSYCAEFLNIVEQLPSIGPLEQVGAYNNVANAFCTADKHEIALDLLQKALDRLETAPNIQQEHQETNRLLLYEIHTSLYSALKGLHRDSDAEKHSKRACEIYRELSEMSLNK